ncbi:MAG TPA: hypothetical protein VD948_02340 [Rhodothermales bacterium]|nr:hypothetical protein [Rhodothermales bacterium]
MRTVLPRTLASALLGATTLLAVPTAFAQKEVGGRDPLNWRASPVYGTVQLTHGFSPDPQARSVNAGGTTRNPVSGSGCTGYLNASAPDLDVNYDASSFDLTISAASDTDVSLVVHTPDGRWLCDDDSADAPLNAKLTISNPVDGVYSIWVATYAETSDRPSTQVGFSELGREVTVNQVSSSSSSSSNGNLPNWTADPTYGRISLRAGFRPDPHVRDIVVGGSTRNPVSGSGCAGFINASAPDYELSYEKGSGVLPLNFYVKSDVDVSLLIYTADGQWVCDDDSGDGLNPWIRVNGPASGTYQIWVGAYRETNNYRGSKLYISELDPRW